MPTRKGSPTFKADVEGIRKGDLRSLAKALTIVENQLPGYRDLLELLTIRNLPILGFTGPPGAGKSTLVNQLINHYSKLNSKTGIIAVDPTSPFNFGALLGDRIRMVSEQTDHVFIRSVASRGSLGGLSDAIIEIVEVMKSFPFDQIVVETVGVGQAEVDIAGVSDVTIVVLVPESGDHIQMMKAGLMEIADIFVVNKSDHPNAANLVTHLVNLLDIRSEKQNAPPIIKTVATNGTGIPELMAAIETRKGVGINRVHRKQLMAERIYRIIQKQKMKDFDKEDLYHKLEDALKRETFNLYQFIRTNYPN